MHLSLCEQNLSEADPEGARDARGMVPAEHEPAGSFGVGDPPCQHQAAGPLGDQLIAARIGRRYQPDGPAHQVSGLIR